jgi:site-specific DNA-methyltransferase (adenine-specific)
VAGFHPDGVLLFVHAPRVEQSNEVPTLPELFHERRVMDFIHKQIGDCLMIQGDCRDVLAVVDPVDHIFADPPYEKEAHKKGRRTQKTVKDGSRQCTYDDLDFAAITEDLRDFVAKWGTENCHGWVMYFCQAESVGIWRDAIEANKGNYKRPMVWIKPDSTPQFNGQMPAIGFESMVLQWAGKGHSRWNSGGKRGVYTHCTNQKDRDGTHKTEKPLPLMMELLNDFTKPGDTILDMFAGSGTTGIAAAKMGRRFIGIEKDPVFFELACRRIAAAPGSGQKCGEPPPFELTFKG